MVTHKAVLAAVLFLALSCACEEPVKQRIIDGTNVPVSRFPQVAQIIIDNGNGTGILGSGALISPIHVLTAAHAVTDDYAQITATPDNTTVTMNRTRYGLSNVYLHPSWVQHRADKTYPEGEFDVAIIELDSVSALTPIPIYNGDLSSGITVTLVGFGQEGTGATGANGTFPPSGTVNDGTVVINKVTPTFLKWLFQPRESSVAPGDSGGPVLIKDSNGTVCVTAVNTANLTLS